MENDLIELIRFLKSLGIQELSKGEKKILLAKLQQGNNVENLKKELELLYSLNRILVNSYSRVSLLNMMDICSKLDQKVLFNLFVVYQQINNRAKSEFECLKVFRKTCYNILTTFDSTNILIKDLLQDTFTKVESIKNSLYLTMTDKAKADKLYDNCIKRSKEFLDACDAKNLEEIIIVLKQQFNLSNEELVGISSRCATFFSFSSASKIVNIQNSLNEFKQFISNRVIISEENLQVLQLLNRDYKDIILNSSSLLTNNSQSLNNTLRFLMGESIGDILKNDKLKQIKGVFTPLQLAKIYNESITSLGISVEKVGEVCLNLSKLYKKHFNEELDLSNFVNGHNFVSIGQLATSDYLAEGKADKIFKLLSSFLDSKDMANLLANNVGFLIASEKEANESIKEAILNSRNNDELKARILQKIRNHLDHYKDGFNNVNREASVRSEKLKKVTLKEMDEETLRKILLDLNTPAQEVDKWLKEWNKEEKEYRELEIELVLEETLGQLKDLETIQNLYYADMETYLGELLVVKGLYEEVISKYKESITNVKLNKHLKQLNEEVEKEIEEVRSIINGNFDLIIANYNESLQSLNKQLKELQHKRHNVVLQRKALAEMDERIQKENISVVRVKEKMELIDQLQKQGEEFKKLINSLDRRQGEYDNKTEQFLDSLIANTSYYSDLVKNSRLLKLASKENKNMLSPEVLYVFKLFIVSLVNDGLIMESTLDDMEDVAIEIQDTNISYDTFRKMLDKESLEIADDIHQYHKENVETRKKIRETLYAELIAMGCEEETITRHDTYVLRLLSYFFKKVNEERKKVTDEQQLLASRSKIAQEEREANIELILSQMDEVKESIKEYIEKIANIESKKV